MAYKLHTNGVVTGCLNSFCLACDTLVSSEQEANDHISTSLHMKNLSMVKYSDKFKDEHIRKFKLGYFCEFCNVLLPIAAKVTLHVTEDEHKHSKGIHLLKHMGRDVFAFNNIRIEEKAWHGLMEEICSVCNEEFDDEDQHKSETNHSLNLVLKPVKFGMDNAIYRHIDDSAVQCLTCNKLISPNMISEHFNDAEHHELYSKRQFESNNICEKMEITEIPVTENGKDNMKSTINNNFKNNRKTSAEEKSKILESIVKYQCKGININLETETAFCKNCSEVITFEFLEIEKHIETHSAAEKVDSDLKYPSALDQNLNRVNINDKSSKISEDLQAKEATNGNIKISEALPGSENKKDSTNEQATDTCSSSSRNQEKNNGKCDQAEASDYATENLITYNEDNGNAYCRICDVRLPSSLRSMKEHVSGATHMKMVLQSSQPNQAKPASNSAISKIESRNWIKSAYDVENIFGNDTVVNEEYCLPQISFWLITNNNSRLRCIICEENLPPHSDVELHVKNKHHGFKMGVVPMITSEKSEVIREVRPGVYHCGYCNLVVSSWDDMKQHLKCSDHKETKARYELRLRLLLPDIQEHKRRQQMDVMRLFWMLNRF